MTLVQLLRTVLSVLARDVTHLRALRACSIHDPIADEAYLPTLSRASWFLLLLHSWLKCFLEDHGPEIRQIQQAFWGLGSAYWWWCAYCATWSWAGHHWWRYGVNAQGRWWPSREYAAINGRSYVSHECPPLRADSLKVWFFQVRQWGYKVDA